MFSPSQDGTKTAPLGAAVIGAGYWGKKVISEYLAAERNGDVRLLKVCDLR